jgi:molybdopterin-guanine dinucleotide biosynthesis protein A
LTPERHRPVASHGRPLVGIVLAGGQSRRFGSDKLAADVGGVPLVVRAIEAVRVIPGLERVVVVGPAPGIERAWVEVVEALGAEVVRDEEAFGGPLAGLAVGLRVLPEDAIAVVVAGDMPFLDPAVLAHLAREILTRTDVDVALLVSDARTHPLPIALDVATARPLAERCLERGAGSLRAFVDGFGRRVGLTSFDPSSLRDVDSPGDLRPAAE